MLTFNWAEKLDVLYMYIQSSSINGIKTVWNIYCICLTLRLNHIMNDLVGRVYQCRIGLVPSIHHVYIKFPISYMMWIKIHKLRRYYNIRIQYSGYNRKCTTRQYHHVGCGQCLPNLSQICRIKFQCIIPFHKYIEWFKGITFGIDCDMYLLIMVTGRRILINQCQIMRISRYI